MTTKVKIRRIANQDFYYRVTINFDSAVNKKYIPPGLASAFFTEEEYERMPEKIIGVRFPLSIEQLQNRRELHNVMSLLTNKDIANKITAAADKATKYKPVVKFRRKKKCRSNRRNR